jgi:hypothetical protein
MNQETAKVLWKYYKKFKQMFQENEKFYRIIQVIKFFNIFWSFNVMIRLLKKAYYILAF